jgi:hypothetical protein
LVKRTTNDISQQLLYRFQIDQNGNLVEPVIYENGTIQNIKSLSGLSYSADIFGYQSKDKYITQAGPENNYLFTQNKSYYLGGPSDISYSSFSLANPELRYFMANYYNTWSLILCPLQRICSKSPILGTPTGLQNDKVLADYAIAPYVFVATDNAYSDAEQIISKGYIWIYSQDKKSNKIIENKTAQIEIKNRKLTAIAVIEVANEPPK